MIMNATGLLLKNPSPSHQEIKEGMEDNLCRCGAHVRIVEAIADCCKRNERREVTMKKERSNTNGVNQPAARTQWNAQKRLF